MPESTHICLRISKGVLAFAVIMCCLSVSSLANIDSLTRQYFGSKDKSTQIDVAIQLGRFYKSIDLDSLFQYGKRLEIIASPDRFYGLTQAYNFQGLYYYYQSELDSAVAMFRKQLRTAQQANDSAQIAHALNSLGATFSNKGNIQTGLKYYRDAFRIRQDVGLDDDAIETLYNICVTMIENTVQYSDVEIDKYLRMVEKHWLKKPDKKLQLAYLYIAWSLSYSNKSMQPDSTLIYAEKAMQYIDADDEHSVMYLLPSIGSAQQQKGLYNEAEASFLKAIAIGSKYAGSLEQAAFGQRLAKLYLDLNRLEDARKTLNNNDLLLAKLEDLSRNAQQQGLWAQYYEKNQQWQKAFEASQRSRVLYDSLHATENVSEIISMRNLFEEERLEFENNLLAAERDIQKQKAAKEKARRNAMLALALGIFLITALLWYQYRQKNRYSQQLEQLNKKLSESERQLMKLNAAKDKYFSILSHDLRNPLMAFESLSEKLIFDQPEQQKETARLMHQQSVSLRNLLNNILVWSKSQQGMIQMQPQALLWRDICEEALQLYAAEASSKGVSLINHVNSDLLVFADKQAMQTVLRNLVGNAMKFTHTGSISIYALDENGAIKTTVADTGIGIPAEQLPRIFDLSGKQQSGLGLLLCKELIEANKGAIYMENHENGGLNVDFHIPSFAYED